jgi:hypothetical protein
LLRAYLGRLRDWVSATERAVRVSRILALLMLLSWPLFQFNLVLPLIALFVFVTGTQELMGVRLRHGLVPFGRYGDRSRPAPLFGSLFGFNPARGFQGGFGAPSADEREQPRDAQHEDLPGRGGGFSQEPARGGGFSHQEIEQLERFPGRLRQFRGEEGGSR